MANLTNGRLEAIIAALEQTTDCLAGNIPRSDYVRARDWAVEELAKRRGELPRSARAKEPIFRRRDERGVIRSGDHILRNAGYLPTATCPPGVAKLYRDE